MREMIQQKVSMKRLNYLGRLFFGWGIFNFIFMFILGFLNSFSISTYSATDPLQKKDLLILTQISFLGFVGVGLLISGTLILLKTLHYQNESHTKPDIKHRDA